MKPLLDRATADDASPRVHAVGRRGRSPLLYALPACFTGISAALVVIAFVGQGCATSRPEASDGRGTTPGYVATGPCEHNGEIKECHVETGRIGPIVNCFSGTQTCTDGLWGPCGGGASGTLSTVDLSLSAAGVSGGSLRPLTVTATTPSADAGACASNPCNPYCLGVDVDAGNLQPDGGIVTVAILGTLTNITTFPSAKQNANAVACSQGTPPADYKVCSYDYCCSSTLNKCVQWVDSVKASKCTAATGVDYTVGIGCQDAAGKTHIPVCNRGTANSPATGKLAIMGYPANPNAAGSSTVCANSGSTPAEGCIIDLAVKPITMGNCIDVDVSRGAAGTQPGVTCASAADFGSGNRTSMINPAPTTTLPASLAAANGGTTTYAQLAETDKCNNYSFVYTQVGSCASYGTQPPPPSAQSFTYVATCLPGNRVQWNQFSYATLVPATSEVIFTASTAPLSPDGGVGAFTAPVQIADPKTLGPDPATCSMSGTPAGCPKPLGTLLGTPANTYEVLTIGVTLISTTSIPTAQGWQVSYNCIPQE